MRKEVAPTIRDGRSDRTDGCLGKRKKEVEGGGGKLNARINQRRVDGGAKGKEREAGGSAGNIGGDAGRSDRLAGRVSKTETDEVVNRKESARNPLANCSRFDPSVVGIAGDVAKCGNQLSGREQLKVAEQEIGSVIESGSFQRSSAMDCWRRGDNEIDCVT